MERRGGWGGDVKERERWRGKERRVGRRCEGEGEVERRGGWGGDVKERERWRGGWGRCEGEGEKRGGEEGGEKM